MGSASSEAQTARKNYVNSGNEKKKKNIIWCNADALRVDCARDRHWIELIDNNRNRTLSVWLVAVFLPMNFDHYCSIIRIAWILYCVRVQHQRIRAKTQLDNSITSMWAFAVSDPALISRVARPFAGSECWATASNTESYTKHSRSLSLSFIQYFFFSLCFLHLHCAWIYRQVSCVCVRWCCAACGPNSTFTFNRQVENARAPCTLINQIDRSMSMHTLTYITTYSWVAMHFDLNETNRNGRKKQKKTNNFIFSIHHVV